MGSVLVFRLPVRPRRAESIHLKGVVEEPRVFLLVALRGLKELHLQGAGAGLRRHLESGLLRVVERLAETAGNVLPVLLVSPNLEAENQVDRFHRHPEERGAFLECGLLPNPVTRGFRQPLRAGVKDNALVPLVRARNRPARTIDPDDLDGRRLSSVHERLHAALLNIQKSLN